MSNGEGGGPQGIGGIISAIAGAIFGFTTQADVQAAIEQSIQFTYVNVLSAENFLFGAISGALNFIKQLLGTVLDGLRHVIQDVLHGHLLQALKDIQKLINDLHNLFAPLIAWLRRLQAIQRQYQLQAMRRMINLIQRARQVLVLFKLLHVKWAQKLDSILAGIEGRLIAREIDIVRKSNQIIGWINFITDPLGVFRPGTVLGPIGAWLAALSGAARALDLGKVFPGLTSSPGANGSTVPWQHFRDTWEVEGPTRTGSYGDFHAGALKVRTLLDKDIGT